MNGNNINLMYVEDDVVVNDTITSLLQKLGYTVYNFFNGEDAYNYYVDNKIDLVISDIDMPKINGIELVEKIKAVNTKTPIIFTTAISDEKYLLDSINLGIDLFMKKPIDCGALKQNIEKVLKPYFLELENEAKEEKIKQQAKEILIAKTVSMISHQWRQPLSKIGSITSKIRVYSQMKKLTEDILITNLEKIERENIYLSSTINKFNKLLEKKDIRGFSLKELLEDINKDEISIDMQNNVFIKSDYEEFKNIFESILKNSYEQFDKNKIENRKINITTFQDDEFFYIKICDNAGGIDEDILTNVFDLYHSDKSLNGRGLGLYLSKVSLTLLTNGEISLENIENKNENENEKGVCVRIKIPTMYVS
ncbi:response regulator [Arcobacter sp. CECT 8983]|uniref:ATP-binding response regulator n=1 Tax=Arcobacter sp. CECT 8983 TaxID=2044508 RepID=UPI0013E94A3F|nr:response regulator [Arcobacter sp. CECT 8983]